MLQLHMLYTLEDIHLHGQRGSGEKLLAIAEVSTLRSQHSETLEVDCSITKQLITLHLIKRCQYAIIITHTLPSTPGHRYVRRRAATATPVPRLYTVT